MTLPFTQRTRLIVGAASLGAIILAISVLGGRAVSSRLAAATALSAAARNAVLVANQHAEQASKFATALQDSVVAAKRASVVATARADSAQRTADHYRGAFAQLAKVAPDTCKPVIVAADSAQAADSVTIAGLRNAHAADTAAIRLTEQQRDSLRVALTQAVGAGKSLVVAEQHFEQAAKGGPFLLRILPKLSLGIGAGVDKDGRAHAIAGIFAGWSIP